MHVYQGLRAERMTEQETEGVVGIAVSFSTLFPQTSHMNIFN